MNDKMRARTENAKRTDRIMTILFTMVGGFFLLLIIALAGYIIVNGIRDFTPETIAFKPSGLGNQLFNTLYLMVITLIISCLVGIPAGIYMAEYAGANRLTEIIRMSIESLSSLPSIVVGLFGFLMFVIFPKAAGMNVTWSLLAGALTMSVLTIPLISTSTEDAIRSLPPSFVQGSMALGSTHWYAIIHTVLPAALPRIITGIILAAGRIFGEATALMYTAGMATRINWANTNITSSLNAFNVFRPGETLALHIYVMKSEGLVANADQLANVASMILVIIVLLFSISARYLTARINKKQSGESN